MTNFVFLDIGDGDLLDIGDNDFLAIVLGGLTLALPERIINLTLPAKRGLTLTLPDRSISLTFPER